MHIRIEPAAADDAPAIVALLIQHRLPADGVGNRIDTTVVARHDGRLVGTAALEPYADGVLLRSVAVAPEYQNCGVGRDLMSAALRLARDRSATAAYLLTTTAPDYFPRFGFERIERTDVPPLVRASTEFTSACPASAVVMRCRLPPLDRIVFACVHNAGRSQMAAAFFAQLADPSKAEALSAGTVPAAHVHSTVVDAMREVGIDLGGAKPRLLTADVVRHASLLVTMGCGESCPLVPGVHVEDWPLPDPQGKSVQAVRSIRDDIRQRVAALVSARGWARPRSEPR